MSGLCSREREGGRRHVKTVPVCNKNTHCFQDRHYVPAKEKGALEREKGGVCRCRQCAGERKNPLIN